MNEMIFIITLATILISLLVWGFRVLPGERWQMLAAVPLKRDERGQWTGLNLTYYGFFNACAYTLAVAIMLILMAAIQVPVVITFTIAATLLAICMPASRLVAWLVEGKKHTFTVGGAFFVGTIAGPIVVLIVDQTLGRYLGVQVPIVAVLAGMMISYTFGEALGRLACISFGCCYGKRIADCPPAARTLLRGWHFVFIGETKKANYEGGHQHQPLIPVQAITATLLTITALIATVLFLAGWYTIAVVSCLFVTQIWRVFSEFLRADLRGTLKFTAYQRMALAACILAAVLVLVLPSPIAVPTDISLAVNSLWNPLALLGLQALWIAAFLFTGRSEVTRSTLSFHVRHERI